MNDIDHTDLKSFDDKNNEVKRMLDDSNIEDFSPIQKNSKLFKFILYTSKIEIKSNSLIKLIYNTSLLEVCLWIVGLLLFFSSPGNMYLIWVLIVHCAKAFLGLQIVDCMPKTYEIIENLARNPNFEEDKIMELIQTQVREVFLERWTQNKGKLMWYLISNIVCLVVDTIIFIVQIIIFGNENLFLMQTSLLFIIIIFFSKLILIFSI